MFWTCNLSDKFQINGHFTHQECAYERSLKIYIKLPTNISEKHFGVKNLCFKISINNFLNRRRWMIVAFDSGPKESSLRPVTLPRNLVMLLSFWKLVSLIGWQGWGREQRFFAMVKDFWKVFIPPKVFMKHQGDIQEYVGFIGDFKLECIGGPCSKSNMWGYEWYNWNELVSWEIHSTKTNINIPLNNAYSQAELAQIPVCDLRTGFDNMITYPQSERDQEQNLPHPFIYISLEELFNSCKPQCLHL